MVHLDVADDYHPNDTSKMSVYYETDLATDPEEGSLIAISALTRCGDKITVLDDYVLDDYYVVLYYKGKYLTGVHFNSYLHTVKLNYMHTAELIPSNLPEKPLK